MQIFTVNLYGNLMAVCTSPKEVDTIRKRIYDEEGLVDDDRSCVTTNILETNTLIWDQPEIIHTDGV